MGKGPEGCLWRRLGERLWYNAVWGFWASTRFFVIFGVALVSGALGGYLVQSNNLQRGESRAGWIWLAGVFFFFGCLVCDVVISTRKANRRRLEEADDDRVGVS